jgi:hypothetical protein
MRFSRFAALVVLSSGVLAANTGIPTLAFTLPGMIILLIPVIALETFMVRRGFSSWWPALRTMSAANVFSTLVGIPCAWLLALALQTVFAFAMMPLALLMPWQAQQPPAPGWPTIFVNILISPAWLMPFVNFERSLYWTIPAATLIMLAPYCYASYRSELWIARRLLARQSGNVPELEKLIWRANSCSYAALGLGVLIWLGCALATHSR